MTKRRPEHGVDLCNPRMNILQTIVEHKKTEVARLPEEAVTPEGLQRLVRECGARRPFLNALRQPVKGSVALIAEVKKASPSAGIICPDFDPVRIARGYEAAGASCLSVLTDEKYFQGALRHLGQIRDAVGLPLLRKDFMIDDRQIPEAIQGGADAILLIAAILDDDCLRRFMGLAGAAGLAALVEVHDEAELDRAVGTGATLLGVNNRNLATFEVDLGTTERLAGRLASAGMRDRVTLVGESGIHTRADVERLERAGAGAILVGETLMRDGDVAAKVAGLLG